MNMTLPLALVSAAILAISFGGCDVVTGGPNPLEEGQQLEVEVYSDSQPSGRLGFSEFGTFVVPGRVFVFAPGTGPDDPPQIVRSIRIPEHLTNDAQIDRDGFLWVATPDRNSTPLRVAYVIDPSTGEVLRVIELPGDLRAVAALLVGPDQVYLRSWRDGFSGAIGSVDRQCVTDASRCSVSILTDLGDVGTTPEQAFHLDGNTLFSFSNPNSRSNRESIDKVDISTGKIIKSTPFGSTFSFDESYIYTVAYFTSGTNSIVKIDKDNLDVLVQKSIGSNISLISIQGDLIYLTGFNSSIVEVRHKDTMEMVRQIDVSSTGGATALFGFVAPDVLLLNHTSFLNTRSDDTVLDAFPINAQFSQGLRLPEGDPLAY